MLSGQGLPSSSKKKPLVIVTRTLPSAIETRLMELFDTRLNADDKPLTAAELVEAVKTADVLVPTVTDRIDSRVLSQAGPRLKLIASFGTGVDHIDLDTARQRGITVTNTPGVLTEDTADMSMALVLATARRMGAGERAGARRQMDRLEPDRDAGRAGCSASAWASSAWAASARRWRGARAASALPIHYHNRKRVHADIERELEATYWESLDQMLARMDIVSVNCPHTPATFHLLSARRLKLMKPTAIIVNTARGEVIDENAMVRMLKAGELAGAGLDVYEHEPQVNPKLLELDSVVLLPHMGSATLEGRIEMGEKVLINIKTFADGHKPPDRVLATMF